MFRIWCEVSGGVTGTREAWLKENGTIAEYARREDADAACAMLKKSIADNPHRKASFRYSVREV